MVDQSKFKLLEGWFAQWFAIPKPDNVLQLLFKGLKLCQLFLKQMEHSYKIDSQETQSIPLYLD